MSWDNDLKQNSKKEKTEKEGVKPRGIDLKKYKDLSGVTIKKLDWGLWYIEHRRMLKKIFYGFLILAGATSWSYTIYGFAHYLFRGMAEDEIMARDIAEKGFISRDAVLKASPRNLVFDFAKALKADGKKYDLFVQVKNPSENHGALFEYYFSANNEETPREQGFILPNETKYLLALGKEFNLSPANIQFRIGNISWKRIDKHQIPDWAKYRDEHLDISISDAKFIPAKASGLSEKISLNQAEFNAKNNSPFNYWNVDFVVIFFGGANVVGVSKYNLEEFMSGQEKKVSLTWPGAINYVSKIEIMPEVNLLRDDIYIRFEGEGEEK
jgi:hypothetical protein